MSAAPCVDAKSLRIPSPPPLPPPDPLPALENAAFDFGLLSDDDEQHGQSLRDDDAGEDADNGEFSLLDRVQLHMDRFREKQAEAVGLEQELHSLEAREQSLLHDAANVRTVLRLRMQQRALREKIERLSCREEERVFIERVTPLVQAMHESNRSIVAGASAEASAEASAGVGGAEGAASDVRLKLARHLDTLPAPNRSALTAAPLDAGERHGERNSERSGERNGERTECKRKKPDDDTHAAFAFASPASDDDDDDVHEEDAIVFGKAMRELGVSVLHNSDEEEQRIRTDTQACIKQLFQRMFEPELQKTEFKQRDECPRCRVDLVKRVRLSQLVCPKCGVSTPYIENTCDGLAFGQDYEIPEHVYERVKYFRMWLSQYLRGVTLVPDDVIRKVFDYLCLTHNNSTQKIRPTPVRNALKDLGLPEWCPFHERITARLKGEPMSEFNNAEFERILWRFRQIQVPFWLLKEPNRKNFANFNFTVRKVCQMEGWDHFTPFFALPKTKGVQTSLDMVWQRICNMLEQKRKHPNEPRWLFYRTA